MTALISGFRFENLAKGHKTEHGAKGLRSRTQFVTMLFGRSIWHIEFSGWMTGFEPAQSHFSLP